MSSAFRKLVVSDKVVPCKSALIKLSCSLDAESRNSKHPLHLTPVIRKPVPPKIYKLEQHKEPAINQGTFIECSIV